MDNIIPGSGVASSVLVGVPVQASDESDTLRRGLMQRALRHARTRELMGHMMQRHAMHRRMMQRAMRHALDD